MRADATLEEIMMLGKDGKRRGWQRIVWIGRLLEATEIQLQEPYNAVRDKPSWRADTESSQVDLMECNNNNVFFSKQVSFLIYTFKLI